MAPHYLSKGAPLLYTHTGAPSFNWFVCFSTSLTIDHCKGAPIVYSLGRPYCIFTQVPQLFYCLRTQAICSRLTPNKLKHSSKHATGVKDLPTSMGNNTQLKQFGQLTTTYSLCSSGLGPMYISWCSPMSNQSLLSLWWRSNKLRKYSDNLGKFMYYFVWINIQIINTSCSLSTPTYWPTKGSKITGETSSSSRGFTPWVR